MATTRTSSFFAKSSSSAPAMSDSKSGAQFAKTTLSKEELTEINDKIINGDTKHEELTKILERIPKIENLDAWDTRGNTLMAAAASRGWDALIKLLISQGAKVNVPDNSNKNPLDWAQIYKRYSTIDLLEKYGAQKSQGAPCLKIDTYSAGSPSLSSYG